MSIGMLVCLGLGCAGASPKAVQVESTQEEPPARVEDDKTETSTDQGAGEVDLDSVEEEEIDLGREGSTRSGPISVESGDSGGEGDNGEEDEEGDGFEAAKPKAPKKGAKRKPQEE